MLPIEGWDGEQEKVIDHAKKLTMRYAAELLNNMDSFTSSPNDKSLVLAALLLFAQGWTFCMHLGNLKFELEARYIQAVAFLPGQLGVCGNCRKPTSYQIGDKSSRCTFCGIDWTVSWPPKCPKCNNGAHLPIGDGVSTKCPVCRIHFRLSGQSIKYDNGRLVHTSERWYKEHVSVAVPDSPKDPKHYGHVIWQCCLLLKAFDAKNES